MKYIFALAFVIIIVLANAVGNLVDKNKYLESELQTQVEKVSDLENALDEIHSNKLIKDYL